MIELGVNIDHVATLRQQRLTTYPDPLKAARLAEEAGADLITLHLREDRRHIVDKDVYALRKIIRTRMNLECAITKEMLDISCSVLPDDVCLVPEKRNELTTEGGLDVIKHYDQVVAAVKQLQEDGIRVSIFIDPEVKQIEAAKEAGATVVELHTGTYADAPTAELQALELERLRVGTQAGVALGLRINAGHGLHYYNVQPVAAIEGIAELNIGHAIVSEAIFVGWTQAIRNMKALMRTAQAQNR